MSLALVSVMAHLNGNAISRWSRLKNEMCFDWFKLICLAKVLLRNTPTKRWLACSRNLNGSQSTSTVQ